MAVGGAAVTDALHDDACSCVRCRADVDSGNCEGCGAILGAPRDDAAFCGDCRAALVASATSEAEATALRREGR